MLTETTEVYEPHAYAWNNQTADTDRGFGFIRGEDANEYFFHRSELRGGLRFEELKEGQPVNFEPRHADKGPRASEVNPAAA